MLKVKKFGGTSVADKEKIFNVVNICKEDYKKRRQNNLSIICNGEEHR